MPIAVNGSGSITGISVGGLPDGIVDRDTLQHKQRVVFFKLFLQKKQTQQVQQAMIVLKIFLE